MLDMKKKFQKLFFYIKFSVFIFNLLYTYNQHIKNGKRKIQRRYQENNEDIEKIHQKIKRIEKR